MAKEKVMRMGRVVVLTGLVVAARAVGLQGQPARAALEKPEAFGTSQTTYVTVGEWEFVPTDSSHPWGDKAENTNLSQKYAKEPWMTFIAGPKLPGGALLTYLEFDYCDDNGAEDLLLALEDFDYRGNALSTVATIVSSGAPGCVSSAVDLTALNYTVDNYTRRFRLMVSPGGNGDETTRFAGAIIGYRLQVSPAPGAPTFNDVPLSHPFFQYVEALAASGITGGCGGGNFCPDNAVTRGQIAVFLAKALGLQFR